MSPLTNNLDTIDTETDGQLESRMSDMRRCSLSLAFSPARHRRRKTMNNMSGWLKNKLGISSRRASRVQ
jgi:hypothetical protein